ncbi:hypothetical protein G7046_g1324 [Stylonectria norvegica]|nr:hypothetical protein G7046_g1324 [Stylonectria norvegica]
MESSEVVKRQSWFPGPFLRYKRSRLLAYYCSQFSSLPPQIISNLNSYSHSLQLTLLPSLSNLTAEIMKTSTSFQLAAAGILSLASMVAADIPACAIDCFQGVITDHPPLECKEADMYHCFCKDPFGPPLQEYYLECARSDCGSSTDAQNAIQFGVDLCSELGFPITIPIDQPTSPATTSKAPMETTTTKAGTTSAAGETTSAAQPTATATENSSAVETSFVTESASETSVVIEPTNSATKSSSASASGSTTTPAGETTTATESGSVSQPITTVTAEIPVTTTICDASSEPEHTHTVVSSAPWACPHGCNSTVTRVSSLTVITKISSPSEPAGSHSEIPNPSEPAGSHSEIPHPSESAGHTDTAHATVSQGSATPSGTDVVVVPTKSTGGDSSVSPISEATPSTVVVNMGNSASVSSFLAAAGVAVAVWRLL